MKMNKLGWVYTFRSGEKRLVVLKNKLGDILNLESITLSNGWHYLYDGNVNFDNIKCKKADTADIVNFIVSSKEEKDILIFKAMLKEMI